ncbi:unnamed protein product [Caenorhabditis sp. 36 PRJEB53466]|nr:unnamed protein product [Caenorhabditis sp. 36 PRJEB53466]
MVGKSDKEDKILLVPFLYKLLADRANGDIIRWTNEATFEFQLKDHNAVAAKWGEHKGNPKMSYDTLSRAIRDQYNTNFAKACLILKNSTHYQYCRFTEKIVAIDF